MQYGKLENGNLSYAPNPLWLGSDMIANPTEAIYKENGYKPIKSTEQPEEDGFYFTPKYEETDTEILQTWVRHEIEELDN